MTVRILVVDDSVVIRKLLTATFSDVPGMEVVATASLGRIALAKIPQVQPDVVILDVEMPEMDGIETLRRIRKDAPLLPVIMFSTKTERGAVATIEALTCGASDYVTKPSNVGNVLLAMARVREEMVPKIQALTARARSETNRPTNVPLATTPLATTAKTTTLPLAAAALPISILTSDPASAPGPVSSSNTLSIPVPPAATPAPAKQPLATTTPINTAATAKQPAATMILPAMPPAMASRQTQVIGRSDATVPTPVIADVHRRANRPSLLRHPVEIVAIGASTGGPNALAVMLTQLPADFAVPIVIVQHMLATFTRHFATRLSNQCQIRIAEATAGDALAPGCAYIARGDYHLLVERRAGRCYLVLNQDKVENFCRPAVDVLFRSVAHTYGPSALAVVLTGMGHDGMLGCTAIREAGGEVIVQDEPTSVVWGMPGFVARAGLANQVMPLDQLSAEVRRRVALGGPRTVGAML
jgi:two-component system chemotaxis response regulator CheB